MSENTNMAEVVSEIQNATEEELREVIEKWFNTTRTSGMKIGAQSMSAAIFGVIKKHLKKTSAPSLRDYKRCVDEIVGIISVQLAEQNNSEKENETNDMVDEVNDG